MKKTHLLILGLIVLPFIMEAQSVPNGDFENWTQSSSYEDPTGWDSPNSVSSALGIITVTKESSIVQNGSYSARLQTKSIIGTPIPGLLTLGDFNINVTTFEATITGGVPFTDKPEALHGYYQYEPVFNDEAFIAAILLKQNGSNWDTIADGSFTSTSTLLTWTPFTATLNYRSPETPTHLNIIILSSDRNAPQPNSTLYVDNLSLSYPSNIEDEMSENLKISFSDGTLIISSDENLLAITEIEIISLEGKLLQKHQIENNSDRIISIPLMQTTAGVYLAGIQFSDGRRKSMKFLIN